MKELVVLKEKIVSFQSVALDLNKRIQASRGKARADLRTKKKEIGVDARHHLLAYGLLRGRFYETMEQKCRTLPNVEEVKKICLVHAPDDEKCEYTTKIVSILLRLTPAPEELHTQVRKASLSSQEPSREAHVK